MLIYFYYGLVDLLLITQSQRDTMLPGTFEGGYGRNL